MTDKFVDAIFQLKRFNKEFFKLVKKSKYWNRFYSKNVYRDACYINAKAENTIKKFKHEDYNKYTIIENSNEIFQYKLIDSKAKYENLDYNLFGIDDPDDYSNNKELYTLKQRELYSYIDEDIEKILDKMGFENDSKEFTMFNKVYSNKRRFSYLRVTIVDDKNTNNKFLKIYFLRK